MARTHEAIFVLFSLSTKDLVEDEDDDELLEELLKNIWDD